MELGLGILRFSPDAFWRMSLAEWLAARDGLTGGGVQGLEPNPVMAEELDQLMEIYPDRENITW